MSHICIQEGGGKETSKKIEPPVIQPRWKQLPCSKGGLGTHEAEGIKVKVGPCTSEDGTTLRKDAEFITIMNVHPINTLDTQHGVGARASKGMDGESERRFEF
eukprot:scaffold73_cov337-Pavlova_lutheri.AAC.38